MISFNFNLKVIYNVFKTKYFYQNIESIDYIKVKSAKTLEIFKEKTVRLTKALIPM
jgi:hypothetical protein